MGDLKAILAAARHLGGPYGPVDAALFESAATSNRLREGELVALRWGDIDWTEGTIDVRRVFRDMELVAPKGGGARQVRLAPHARLVLLRYRASLTGQGPGDLLFADPTDGGFLDVDALRRRLGAACGRAGLEVTTLGQISMAFKAPWWSRYL